MYNQTYWWCEGDQWSGGIKYNGMYCLHKTEDHDKWRTEEDKRKEERRKARSEPVPSTNDSKDNKQEEGDEKRRKLVLDDSIKACLVTNCGLTPVECGNFVNEVHKESEKGLSRNSRNNGNCYHY